MNSSSARPIVVGNWKMNPADRRSAVDLYLALREATRNISGIETAIATPFVHIAPIADARGRSRKPAVAAQDVSAYKEGSYTGEVSASQLSDIGVTHVIIGHSERRALGESDAMVAAKTHAALALGLTVVLCIGERERDAEAEYIGWLRNQLRSSLAGVPGKYFPRLVIAYEPVWAIGGDEAMDPREIHEMVVFTRREIHELYGESAAAGTRVIYGGSVDGGNIDEILRDGEVDGVLPGRASREPDVFAAICESVRNYRV